MELQEHLMKLTDYNIGCKFAEGYFLINVVFDGNWSIIPPENPDIEYCQKENVHYYCAPLSNELIEEVFSSIYETIDYNIDLAKKVELFKERVSELQDVFSNETYDNLLNLKFVIENKDEKSKKKRGRKKKMLIEEDISDDTANKDDNRTESQLELGSENDEIIYQEEGFTE